ncbi:trace amine-associated receptor 13c-like [Myxocyprinus asiaticus]|uniref:trace amine-associated receptor 13c-like n=1 Tax=Myxocyprinus asiaticus TaxID=70543 RepID=UPI002222CD80|nr:trace amine-associated receptor 13c-like [Myxocyprinus asiaticus]XP_051541300.1 trace amine-associated receptor 13c-like [Myxocyprinus asiaticus]
MKAQKKEQNKLQRGGDLFMAYETEDQTQYCFPAINSSCIKRRRSRYEYDFMYLFFSLLSACTVFLNLLVIISISHFKKLHTPTNLLILSLAVADLLIGLIVVPIEAIRLIETCWYFGDTYCGLFQITLALLLSTSLSTLTFIAADRYMAVCHPLLYPQKITTTKTVMIICLCWFCSSVYNTALVSTNRGFNIINRTDKCYGECTFMINFIWRVTDMLLSFLLPCTLIITLYLRIFYVAHKQVKIINSQLKGGKCVKEGSVRRKSESKATLTLGIIVTVYLLCYIPFFILSLLGNTEMASTSTIILWILYVNSGLNPLIYALFYPWFKMSVKHILTLKIFQPASSLVYV